MEEQVLGTIVSAFIAELAKESKSIFNDLADEGSQLLKRGFKRYLNKQTDKYSFLKTLLKGNTPVYLYNIYYPLKLIQDETLIKTDSIENVFKTSNFVTIIGDAGSGKSTLVKHLFLNSLYTKYAIPILIELRYLNDYENDLKSYIIDRILENKIAENQNILERLLDKGKFVLFLDGYDELDFKSKCKVLENLKSFTNQYINNKFILTSRPYSDIEHFELFHNYYVKKLSLEDGEIEGFIFKQLVKEIPLAKKIVESINSNKSEYIQSFLTNPLLLSLYILTFQSNATVPDKKYIFYRRVIQALFSEHDSKTKLGFVREKLSGLKQEEFENILKTFCFLSFFENKFNWDLDFIYDKFDKIKKTQEIKFNNNNVVKDLKSAVALWVEDNGQYSFAHRSLQEYFAARFVKNLNPEDNKRIYKKIIERFQDVRSINEIENFISLLEEMDILSFNKYYRLKLLKELREVIKNDEEKSIFSSFLNFFSSGIVLNSKLNQYHHIQINKLVYKTIYIHLPFTLKLNRILRNAVRHKTDLKGNDIFRSKRRKKTYEYINFKKDLPTDFLKLIYKDIVELGIEFDEFIDKKIKETECFINKSAEIDKILVDLI